MYSLGPTASAVWSSERVWTLRAVLLLSGEAAVAASVHCPFKISVRISRDGRLLPVFLLRGLLCLGDSNARSRHCITSGNVILVEITETEWRCQLVMRREELNPLADTQLCGHLELISIANLDS
jgi:hypothetical protein